MLQVSMGPNNIPVFWLPRDANGTTSDTEPELGLPSTQPVLRYSAVATPVVEDMNVSMTDSGSNTIHIT